MDYHIIGFRECASEVARYLVTIEGMDIQDPLRLRLMSHLQCFVAQRELSAKSSVPVGSTSNWSNSYQPNYSTQGYQTYPGASPITPQQQQSQQNSFNSSYMTASGTSSTYLTPQSPEYSSSGYGTTANSSTSSAANTSSASNNASTTSPVPNQTTTGEQQQQTDNQQPIYTDLSNPNDRLLNLGSGYHHYGNNQLYGSANNTGYNNNNNNSKPYRPWHPEMAY